LGNRNRGETGSQWTFGAGYDENPPERIYPFGEINGMGLFIIRVPERIYPFGEINGMGLFIIRVLPQRE